MSATRLYVLALVAAVGMAVTATAQTNLYNPISRSFRTQTPRIIPASVALQEAESPAAADEVPEPPADAPGVDAAESASDVVVPEEDPTPAAEDEDTENGEDAPESASDLPVPEVLDEPEVSPAAGCPWKDYCDCDSCRRGRGGLMGGLFSCNPGKPWSLPQPCALQRMGIKMGGWIQQGITANNTNPIDKYNPVVALNDRDGEWQFNQIWMYLSKPIDQRDCRWQVGGHVDIVYGSDWRYGRFFGLEEKINNDNQFYGWVFPQFYLEVGGRNLSVKMGHMAGPLGYEIVPSVANFFYSYSMHMSYTEPQLVTGLWADYKLGDHWTVQAGFHRGFFMFEDLDNNLDFMGGIQWTSCDKNTSLRYAVSVGDNRGLIGETWFASSLVFKTKPTEKFEYVLQHNLGSISDINVGPFTDAEWYGINQYFYYTINKCWKAGMRLEWLRDDDGAKIAGVGNTPPGTIRGWTGGPGYAGNFWELTLGLNWSPHPNVRVRPELRYDWYDGPVNLIATEPPLPFDNGTDDDQLTAAFDILLIF